MRAYIPLPSGLSATTWRRRYVAGEVPDESPYGLHKLADFGVDVTFGETDFGRVVERAARSVRYRTDGMEMLEGLSEWRARALRNTDVVFTYDERIGIPASLLRTRKHAPVMLGVGWLTRRSESPAILAALAGRALQRAAGVWVQSSAMLPVLRQEWAVHPSRLHYVPCGIDANFYEVQPEPNVANVIAGAGEDRHRDHQLLIAAVSSLRSRFPDIQLELATGQPVEPAIGSGNALPAPPGWQDSRDLPKSKRCRPRAEAGHHRFGADGGTRGDVEWTTGGDDRQSWHLGLRRAWCHRPARASE